jgi:hypothetical protein
VKSVAYDYSRQVWVEGPEADEVLKKQLIEELSLLTGPKGTEYLKFTGSATDGENTLEGAIEKCRSRLAANATPAKCPAILSDECDPSFGPPVPPAQAPNGN